MGSYIKCYRGCCICLKARLSNSNSLVICVILNFLISINYCHLNGFNLLMGTIKKCHNDKSNANLPPKYDGWNQDSLSDVTNKVWSNHSSISSKFPYAMENIGISKTVFYRMNTIQEFSNICTWATYISHLRFVFYQQMYQPKSAVSEIRLYLQATILLIFTQ